MAVRHQHHGDSQTEAALFNVNIDRKGQQSLSRVLSSLMLSLAFHRLNNFFENVNILEVP